MCDLYNHAYEGVCSLGLTQVGDGENMKKRLCSEVVKDVHIRHNKNP